MDEITNSNKYCNIQESCKLLIQANNQYDKVVQQNQSLQQELNHYKQICTKIKRIAIKENIAFSELSEHNHTDPIMTRILNIIDEVKNEKNK